jgi:hypothetical protein
MDTAVRTKVVVPGKDFAVSNKRYWLPSACPPSLATGTYLDDNFARVYVKGFWFARRPAEEKRTDA